LSWLDIERDADGLLSSKVLEPLTPGAEAAPWLDRDAHVVYKLFDLHERNIMRDRDGHPTIIDALLGSVSHASKRHLAWLRDAVEDAQARRKGLPVKIRGGLVAAPDEEL
jgi:hypothetical protein